MFLDDDDVDDALVMATREVPENTKAGQSIGDPVVAEDDDDDVLTYTLVDPNLDMDSDDEDSFAIDWATGQIMTKNVKALDAEANGWNRRHLRGHGQGDGPGGRTCSTA